MRILVLALGLVAACVVAACGNARTAELPAPAFDPTRISHEQHAQIACVRCHAPTGRPGKSDHAPCDEGACHEQAFLAPPGPLCKVCHSKVEPSAQPDKPGMFAPLRAYPVDDWWRTMPSKFSHEKHLDSSRMEVRVGFHVACADCHVRDGMKAAPNHATCARCHAPEAGLQRAPQMGDCAGCHETGAQERTRQRLIREDLKFDHDVHKTDRKDRAIRCEECHADSKASSSFADHSPPRVQSCVTCHDDSDRTPPDKRMRICEACHAQRRDSLTAIAPRSHLPATERPIDHTLAFRRDHAEVANRDAQRCATCHVRMSGNPRQACDECHQTMQPADHRVTWRELDHGTEAAADRGRCATCHVVEFCTACHRQKPRSHGLAGEFRLEHGRLARINVRACLTCHVENECAECHAALRERVR
jgi:hypothetical protein